MQPLQSKHVLLSLLRGPSFTRSAQDTSPLGTSAASFAEVDHPAEVSLEWWVTTASSFELDAIYEQKRYQYSSAQAFSTSINLPAVHQ